MAKQNKFALSFSRLNTYRTCPMQFELVVVEKKGLFVESDAMAYGKRVHTQLEKYGKTGNVKELTRESIKWKKLVDMIKAQPGVKQFERKITLDQDLEGVSWFDKQAWMRSILDVLVVNGDTASVLDYKTGKVKPDMLQLQMFACIVFIVFPEVETIKTGFLWLVHDQSTQVVYKRAQFDTMWGKIMELCDEIQDAIDLGVFAPKPSPLCGWCDAKHICSHAERR